LAESQATFLLAIWVDTLLGTSNAEWKLVEKKLQKRLSCWKGNYFLLAEEYFSFFFVISNMVLYMFSFFQIYTQRNTYVTILLKKYRPAKWCVVC
jgi:hypothetical protein